MMLAFLKDTFSQRSLILGLARRDFEQQYRASYLGLLWAFLQPLLLVATLYVVFEFGLRAGSGGSIPFGVYLICGVVPWTFFSSNVSVSGSTFRSYSFLIKKMDFRLIVLPVVKLMGSLPVHGVLVLTAIALAWTEGYEPSLYTLQLLYYVLCLCVLLTGVCLLIATTSIFVKDVGNLVAVLIQFGFWLTPIFWNAEIVPERYRALIEFNPMYYIVSGYRESIALQVPFWEKPLQGTYFWLVAVLALVAGVASYRRLRPHFAEVV